MRPGEFASASIPNIVTFAFREIGPPSPLYIQRDDVLVFLMGSILAGDIVTVNGRLLLPTKPAQIISIQQAFTVPQNAETLFSIPLAEGYLLSVTAQSSSTDQRGTTFVRCFINRGVLGTTSKNAGMVLFADSPTSRQPVGWPNGRQIDSGEGPGRLFAFLGTTPAAGADWSVSVPGVQRWRVMCFNAVLTTGVAVPVRSVQLVLTDGANRYFTGPPSATIPASTTNQVSGSALAVSSTVVATDIALPIPAGLILPQSHVISVLTANLAAADQWSAIVIFVEQWPLMN